jgi:hypothetical protein
MPWDPNKCVNGWPPAFTNADAINLVTNADFTQSVFVQTHATGQTRFGGMTLCVVGHIHLGANGAPAPGNSFIPGWQNWQMVTPAAQVAIIAGLPDGGLWPDGNRYPH